MKNIQRPGILVECGFMSNAAEAEQLQTDTHQRRLSAAIVSGYLQSRKGRSRDESKNHVLLHRVRQ